MELNEKLKNLVFDKSELKQAVYNSTFESFKLFRTTTENLTELFQAKSKEEERNVHFEYINHNDFEFEVRYAGDVLVFLMHTNVFETPRNHEVMKSSYIKEDPTRSYCGIINIYNFLWDSFRYDRVNDLGYLVGRILINKDKHYFIEGKRELGMLYTNFNTSLITNESAQNIVESAIEYTTNFDLLTPPYDEVKVVTVGDIRNDMDKKNMVTAKRLGFRFQADTE